MKIIQKRLYSYFLSLILIVSSIVAILIFGLRLSLDFTGGVLLELEFPKETGVQQVQNVLSPLNLPKLSVTKVGDRGVLLKTAPLEEGQIQKLKEEIKNKVGESTEKRLENVGPSISKTLTNRAVISVILASMAIILYLALSFRSVQKPASSFAFGIFAVVALIHDLIISAGFFAFAGHFFANFEVDSLFIVGLLTILGFSVHDTIVVYDRTRENLRLHEGENFETIVNDSINQTIARSLNTSLTLIFVLLALILIGGRTMVPFVFLLLIGVVVGTYSSIFVASALLVSWHNFKTRRAQKIQT